MATKPEKNIETVISSIERILFYILLSVLPISILPFPWDLTEKGMTIVILFFTLLICILEIVKVVWSGKIAFLKRDSDLIIFLLFLSFVLTTIFAQDSNLSLFGYDYRLSNGLVGLSSVLLLTFLTRSFISTKKEFLNLLIAFFVGSILTTFFSLISFWGGNIFNIVPKIGTLGMEGFPTLGSPALIVTYNCVAVFLGYISLNMYRNDDEQIDASWFSVVTMLVNIFSMIIFSMEKKAFTISILFLLIWFLVLIALFFRKNSLPRKKKINQILLPFSLLVLILVIQIKPIQNVLLGERDILTPISLSLDFSWQITSQTLIESLKNGVLGLGLDSFSVAFTALKPVELVNISVNSSYNEVLTSLSNSGFLWLIIWIILGWYLLKDLIQDIKEFDSRKSIVLILFDALVIFLFSTSFFLTYSIIIKFIFFLLISLGAILRSFYKKENVDNLLLKIWTIGTGNNKKKEVPVMSVFFTAICMITMILGIVKLGKITLSSMYLLRAESYISKQNELLGDREATLDEESEITENLYRWYMNALKYDKSNPLTNRKASVVAVDKLGILIDKYADTEDEDILEEAVNLRSEAFEYSRNAVNISPSIYSSYNSRALVYLGIINLGYTEYIRDAISVINEAIEMKPLDYENYYNKAQLYYLLQDYTSAFKYSTQSLEIAGDYIPALVLSANVNGIQGHIEIQLSYLEAIKTILENNDLQDIQLYEDVDDQIKEIEQEDTSLDTENPEEEGSTTDDTEVSPETEQ
jgi:tetratricopeptide (TPR) repeat protein